MTTVTLYPVAGRAVPDPARGDLLPESGRPVPLDAYWMRRLQDGDVTETAPGDVPKAAKKGAE
ncbi:DUF2635 domain-containing protein [Azoarcus indigens]|uniref:Uncharacterized protein DUF2635 n=1 Tax=Azoarcus indigens TaxID=29545 RepID=A0A4R6DYM2_9RHOO|nr:DUF2635 domain-containing protein [Azoarcus indigens]NMG64885.1 DUF2635 domain-containing protein [Azoarcus indigens]TDN50423.1 uncharacterized protein DUF2635 [Azoarcus indigens]